MRLDHLLSKEKASENGADLRSINKDLQLCYMILSVQALKRGGVAQLGEHLPCKQGVRSSILLISTTVGFTDEGGL